MSTKLILNYLNIVTFASFLWDCTLKITKIEPKLLTDVDMILDYRKAIRGGITRALTL